ncbi:MAG: DUF1553 domain-containing protein [Verrucomicrobiales bacterium]|nr:DUF1553 domain-containing protein [Verrucomicrobiales bacterium]
MRFSTAIFLSVAGLSRICMGDGDGVLFFEKHIRPALIEHCYECHSHESGKHKGGLYLDSKAGWEKGGDIGPAIIPGEPEKSLLLEVISYKDPDLEMPPKKRLSDELVAKFAQWIAMGAPDPRRNRVQSVTQQGTVEDSTGYSPEKGRDFWSFQPRQWQIPEGTKWAKTDIDKFIEAKLAAHSLPRPERAPLDALLRRAKINLTGLPLTIAEQNEFLAGPTTAKWAEMIDRWLDSDSFGERWGRHWLDLARYADTSGGGRSMPLPEAWKFRDFVIKAFNKDMPLDRLILSHVAGDLLPWNSIEERGDNLTASGFLVLGPHNYENQNKDLLELEIADEQIDTVGRAFLGMTIGCARCHDHKFDPVPTKDYYSMAGIFLSSKSVTHANVSKWHLEPVPGSEEIQQQLLAHNQREKELQEAVVTAKLEWEQAGGKEAHLSKSAEITRLAGIVIDDTEADLIGKWFPSTSVGRYVEAGYLHDDKARDTKMMAIFEAPVSQSGTYEVRLAYTPGLNRSSRTPVRVSAGNHTEELRINQRETPEFQSLFTRLGNFYVEKDELITVAVMNEPGNSDGCVVIDAVQILPYDPEVKPDLELERLKKEFEESKTALTKHSKAKPKIPSVMAVADLECEKIGDTPVRIRGDDNTLGDMAPRGFLQVASWEPVSIPEGTSGRLELGEWIVDSRNPLTARVLANRIWFHLLGEGIVPTPDNFGITGQKPTHPELLDYLAQRLIDTGWSTKALIREIMLSEVYQFDSEVSNSAASAVDPENRLYWRANRRQVEAEVLRDSMLKLAGILDENGGGSSLPPKFRSEFGHQFTSLKRSIYVPVFRNTGYEIFRLFDFANPNFAMGKRGRSTVPTQALYLLNSAEVHRYSSEAATRLLEGELKSVEDRINYVFRSCLGRKPLEEELNWAAQWISNGEDNQSIEKWSALYRMIFASLDFRFLR